MPDLHGWITQQIDETEAIALDATPGPWHVTEYNWQTDFDAGIGTSPGEVDVVGHGYEGGGVEYLRDARHIAVHDPANVMRRCTADRKILTTHAPAGGNWDPYACQGCGDDSEYGALVDHTNDCPTLQALAEGYGLTDEQRAALDRPEPERPDPGPGFQMPDVIHNAYAELYREALEATERMLITGNGTGATIGFLAPALREPTPGERAFAILAPHLDTVPLYRPKYPLGGVLPNGIGATADRPPALRGPNWKATP